MKLFLPIYNVRAITIIHAGGELFPKAMMWQKIMILPVRNRSEKDGVIPMRYLTDNCLSRHMVLFCCMSVCVQL
ncbi:MAG: hypothetical protein J5802_08450 [Butyrivibrio sp.]|nr:hypothetical protein [Butyrivibrio sp.]